MSPRKREPDFLETIQEIVQRGPIWLGPLLAGLTYICLAWWVPWFIGPTTDKKLDPGFILWGVIRDLAPMGGVLLCGIIGLFWMLSLYSRLSNALKARSTWKRPPARRAVDSPRSPSPQLPPGFWIPAESDAPVAPPLPVAQPELAVHQKRDSGESSDDAVVFAEGFPYRLTESLLTRTELKFYQVLITVIGEQAVICPKVRVSDILVVTNRWKHPAWANRIDRKHVDFLLCSPESMEPFVVVELDDSSHSRPDRRERDEFLDDAFRVAGLPIVRVPVQHRYDPEALGRTLRKALARP